MRRPSTLLLGLTLLGFANPAGAASTVHVGPGTLLQPILASMGSEGTLLLDGGVYSECLLVPEGLKLTLIGLEGRDKTTLLCDADGARTLHVDGIAQVRGLTIEQRGKGGGIGVNGGTLQLEDSVIAASAEVAIVDGPGLWADDSLVTVTQVDIVGAATSGSGGAIHLSGSDVDLNQVYVAGSSANGDGGAVWALDTTIDAHQLTIDGASGLNGGAIWLSGAGSVLTATDAVFVGNSASGGSGGGVYVTASASATFVTSDFLLNTTTAKGGGLGIAGASTHVTLTGCTFDGNHADERGGGLFALAGTHEIEGGTFSKNTATGLLLVDRYKTGAAVYQAGGQITSRGTTYQDHVASPIGIFPSTGGAVYLEDGSWDSIGDVFVGNQAGRGGAVAIGALADAPYFESTTFTSNFATTAEGGAIYSENGNTSLLGGLATLNHAVGLGGFMYGTAATFTTISGMEGRENGAASGGFVSVGKDATLIMNDDELFDNYADWRGGALFFESLTTNYAYLEVNDTHFEGNSAANAGGAISTQEGQLLMTEDTIVGNSAAYGGGIFLSTTEALTMYGSTLCANTATSDGGGAYLENSMGYRNVYNTVIQENTAGGRGGGWYEYGRKSNFASPTTTFSYLTMAGNKSTSGPHDGLVADGNAPYSIEYTVYASTFITRTPGDYLMSVYPDVAVDETQHNYYGSSLWNGGAGVLYNAQDWTELQGNNDDIDPDLSDWTATGNCLGESLESYESVHVGGSIVGFFGDGIGAGAVFYGYSMWNDWDGDGVGRGLGDCSDVEKFRSPNNTEIPLNGIDDDCFGWDLRDADGDGYVGIDCNEYNDDIHAFAVDLPYDGIDSDCDGRDDFDVDGDGSPYPVDCDDNSPLVSPTAIEVPYDGVVQRCGATDDDLDGDGHAAVETGGDDCDDGDPLTYPGAPDAWYDGRDSDCAGNDDFDQDGDGDPGGTGGTDCDDTDPRRASTLAEVPYDGIDQDCDGQDLVDVDGDGHLGEPAGGDDCDDENPATFPGATEILDGEDNDCDGTGDPDADEDGVLDAFETQYGTDPTNPDSDGDGVPDGVEWGADLFVGPEDHDKDGMPDVLDPDSDNDTLLDGDEVDADSDGDGRTDRVDDDDDDDALDTAVEVAEGQDVDHDGDGVPDYLDPDSDNDGVVDGRDVAPFLDGAGGPASPKPPADGYGFGLGCDTGSSSVPAWAAMAWMMRRRRRIASRSTSKPT